MSRYTLAPKKPETEVCVGWDSPMQTFFGQVFVDDPDYDDEDICVFWAGGKVGEVKTVEQLESLMGVYAIFTEEVREKLRTDYEVRTEPSGLQRLMLDLVKSLKL